MFWPALLDLEAEASHTATVLLDGGLAVSLGICRLGEEHALVALRLLVLADTAGLEQRAGQTLANAHTKGRSSPFFLFCQKWGQRIPWAWTRRQRDWRLTWKPAKLVIVRL